METLDDQDYEYQIFNGSGSMIEMGDLHSPIYFGKNKPKGLYIFKVKHKDSNRKQIFKLIKAE